MDDQALLVEQTLQKVDGLIQKYGTQADSLRKNQQKFSEGIQSLSQVQKWCEQTTEDLQTVAYDCTEMLKEMRTVLDTERFSDLCGQIAQLGKVLKECIDVKDALVSVRPDIQAYTEERFKELNTLLASCDAEMRQFTATKESFFRDWDDRVQSLEKLLQSCFGGIEAVNAAKVEVLQCCEKRFEQIESALQESSKREMQILSILQAGIHVGAVSNEDTENPD